MRPYVYESLDLSSSTFRLVRLVQGEGLEIKCDLFHAALYGPDAMEYEALSYTWGGSDKSHKIEIDGTTLNITESLFDALLHLRYTEEDRILWIDAICIDQDDHKERGHQVRQMAAIYENARQVVIWLGLSTLDTDFIFSYMQQLERQALNHPCNDWAPSDGRWKFLWSSVILSMKRSHGIDANRQRLGFMHLLTRPWFHRIWILQEVAKARRVKVMCGNNTVSSRVFVVLPILLELPTNPHQQAVLDIMPGSLRKHSWWVERRDLHTLLVKFSKAKASDPRDNVYALLGISSDAHNTNFLRPDYDKSLEDVIKATLSFLLNITDRNDLKAQLPSWTMDDFLSYQYFLDVRVLSETWKYGREELFELLLDRLGIPQPVSNWFLPDRLYKRTPLIWAAQTNRWGLVKAFLQEEDVDVNAQDSLGRTSLHYAVANEHLAILKLLMGHKKIMPNVCDGIGRTPFRWGADQGKLWMLKDLLAKGWYDPSITDAYSRIALYQLAEADRYHRLVALLKGAITDQYGRHRLHPEWRQHTSPLETASIQVELVD